MNKNILTGAVVVLAAVAVGFAGYAFAPKSVTISPSLGSYNPAIVSAGGFSQVLATSTTFGVSYFCGPTNVQWLGTLAVATGTLPTEASTTAACPQLVSGASVNGLIVNDSTNTVTYLTGTGDLFKCETQGVGTSSIIGGCTGTQIVLPASTTLAYTAYLDGSTFKVAVGNMSY